MNKLILGILVLLSFTSTTFAEYRLECKNDLSGQEEVVIVEEANSFDEAVRCVELDPQYGYYNYRTCRDASKPQLETTWEEGYNRMGSDYKNYAGEAGAKSCQQDCINDPTCKAWTYVKPNTIQGPKGRCWLKHSQPRRTPNRDCISGIVKR